MLKTLAIAGAAALLAATGASVATAAALQDNGRYHLGNTADTSIDTLIVRDADCLNYEDSAASLRVVHNGYQPANGTVIYRCVKP